MAKTKQRIKVRKTKPAVAKTKQRIKVRKTNLAVPQNKQKVKVLRKISSPAPKVQKVKSQQQSAAKVGKVTKSGLKAYFNVQARNAIPGTPKNMAQAKKIAPKQKLEQPKQAVIRYHPIHRPIHINVVNPAPANPMLIYPFSPSNHQQKVKPLNIQEETRPEGNLENPQSSKDKLLSLQKSLIERCNKTHVKDLLDDLRHEKILSDSEVESIAEVNSTTRDKMRELCNMVRKKGDHASNILLQKVCERDPTLCSSLGIEDQVNSAGQDETPLKIPYIDECSK